MESAIPWLAPEWKPCDRRDGEARSERFIVLLLAIELSGVELVREPGRNEDYVKNWPSAEHRPPPIVARSP